MAEYPGSTSRTYTTTKGTAADPSLATIAAASDDDYVCIQRIDFSSSADGAHTLTINENTAAAPTTYDQEKWKVHITKGGPGPIAGGDAPVFVGSKGRSVRVSLDVASGTATLNVLHY